MKKYVPELDAANKPTGKFIEKEATIADVLNPTVPTDSSGSIVRTALYALLGVLVA